MTIESKMQKAYDLAYTYEDQGGRCSQSTFRALMDVYELDDPTAFRAPGAHVCGNAARWTTEIYEAAL